MPLLCTLCLCLYSILKYFSSDVHGDPPYNYYKKCCILIKTLVVMDSVVAILLLLLISATVSETGYQVIFSRADDVVRNNFTLTCQSTSTGLGLSNAKWLFNSTDYSTNPCTQDAMISGGMMVLTLVPECEGYMQCGTDTILSLPRLLLSEFEIIYSVCG